MAVVVMCSLSLLNSGGQGGRVPPVLQLPG